MKHLSLCMLCSSEQISSTDVFTSGLSIFRCNDCSILFLNPQASGTGFDYPEGFIDKWKQQKVAEGILSQEFEPNIPLIESQYLEVLMPLEHLGWKEHILEIGSGPGLVSLILRNRGFEVTSIEPSLQLASFARETFQLNVKQVSIYEFETDYKYKIVVMNSVIEHLTDPARALNHIRKNLLAPDGRLVITAPNAHSLEYLRDGEKWHNFNGDHLWYFSEISLGNLLEAQGFEIPIWFRHNYSFTPEMAAQENFIRNYLGMEFNPYGGISGLTRRAREH